MIKVNSNMNKIAITSKKGRYFNGLILNSYGRKMVF